MRGCNILRTKLFKNFPSFLVLKLCVCVCVCVGGDEGNAFCAPQILIFFFQLLNFFFSEGTSAGYYGRVRTCSRQFVSRQRLVRCRVQLQEGSGGRQHRPWLILPPFFARCLPRRASQTFTPLLLLNCCFTTASIIAAYFFTTASVLLYYFITHRTMPPL